MKSIRMLCGVLRHATAILSPAVHVSSAAGSRSPARAVLMLAAVLSLSLGVFVLTPSAFATQGLCDTGQNVNVYATAGTAFTGYSTVNAAFTAINAGTHRTVITIEICGNTSESTTQAVLNGSGEGSASYTSVKIYPIIATRTISGTATGGTIKLYGADNVTIDGSLGGAGTDQSLTISNLNTTGTSSAGVWISDYSATDAATGNTVKNCIVSGYTSTTTLGGIIAGSGATIGSAGRIANSNNTIQSNAITTAQYGIFVFGYATSPYDSNWTISGNTVGSTTTAQKLSSRGISLQNATGATVSGNRVLGVTSATATVPYGIYVGSNISGGTISANTISDIKNTRTTSTTSAGLALSATTTASNLTVANNVIYDVASYGAASFTANGWGMYVTAGGGYKIYYNSVRLTTNQSAAGYPAALNVGTGVTTASSLDVRDNIFATSQTLATYSFAIMVEAGTTVFSNLDYNDYYSALGSMGLQASTIYTLAG